MSHSGGLCRTNADFGDQWKKCRSSRSICFSLQDSKPLKTEKSLTQDSAPKPNVLGTRHDSPNHQQAEEPRMLLPAPRQSGRLLQRENHPADGKRTNPGLRERRGEIQEPGNRRTVPGLKPGKNHSRNSRGQEGHRGFGFGLRGANQLDSIAVSLRTG